MKNIYLIATLSLLSFSVKAQNNDSLKLIKAFNDLLSICKNVNFADLNVINPGTFSKAAPYIVYRGNDKKRSWKDVANYFNAEEKKRVDEVCNKINNGINRDSSFRVIKYFTETESEGKWHVLLVSYTAKGKSRQSAFAFLKIKNRFALGDID